MGTVTRGGEAMAAETTSGAKAFLEAATGDDPVLSDSCLYPEGASLERTWMPAGLSSFSASTSSSSAVSTFSSKSAP